MHVVDQISLDLLGSVLFAALGFAGTRAYDTLRIRRRLGHIYALLGSADRITVIFPRSPVPAAVGRPANTVSMSLTDGAAIARIGILCRDARPKTEMVLVHPDDFHAQDGPFVMIGNPEDLSWSRNWVADNFPKLNSYPDGHYVAYDMARWETLIEDNKVKQDFGFIIVGKTATAGSHHFALLWGPSEFGANIAARTFSDLSAHGLSREIYREIRAGESWLLVARAQIVDYGVRTDDDSKIRIVATYPGSKRAMQQRQR